MRRLSYLLLVVLTWYLAGMYRSIPLTALFLTEMVLFVLLAVQTLMFRLTLKVDFSTGWSAGEKGAECPCRVRVRNRGIFPAGRFRLTLQLSYPDGKKKLVRSIYAGAEGHQTTEMEFSILPACCGMIKVELRQIEVYDYLAMFSLSARLKGQMRTAVFPAARTLRIQRPAAPQRWNDLSGTQVLPRKGTSSEVSGLREYHPGDPARRIHWKQSAHTDRLWLREYEQELHGRVYLTLHLPEDTPVEVEIWDAFYEILSALTAGLLEQAAAVQISWRDGDTEYRRDVGNETDCREVLLHLYDYQERMGEAVQRKFSWFPWRRKAAFANRSPEKNTSGTVSGKNAGTLPKPDIAGTVPGADIAGTVNGWNGTVPRTDFNITGGGLPFRTEQKPSAYALRGDETG